MRVTIARLRLAILIVAGLLVAVLIGFLAYARYRIRHIEHDLPAKLGINIQQTASGYTYSQSSGGHTLFTIHASRLIQYSGGGHAVLHDVSITLYGPQGSNRVDKISGTDFDYDPKAQIVQARGQVSIDLQGFGSGASDQNRIHVTTSGLVFNQKTGQADTTQSTEFAFPKASGSSVGAHYNSKTGVLVLDSQIALTTTTKGSPAVIHASYAQIMRDTDQAYLKNPQTSFQGENASADSAIVQFRKNGSAENIRGQGHVRVVSADGAVMTAAGSWMNLDDASHLETADLTGGVNYLRKSKADDMHGTASAGTLSFGSDSRLRHAQFRGGVNFVEQVFQLAHDAKGTAERDIKAEKLDVDFAPGRRGNAVTAQKALATGDAIVNLRTVPLKGPQQLTTMSGDQLLARLTPDGRAIRQLNGAGHTRIAELAKDGSTNVSTGDRLQVTFQAPPPSQDKQRRRRGASSAAQAAQIETVVQDGHVVVKQMPGATSGRGAMSGDGSADVLTAWAERADYRAQTQVMRLTGSPRLQDGDRMQLAGGEIDYHRDTGDAAVSGGVQAVYTEQPSSVTDSSGKGEIPAVSLGGDGPVHVTADHAVLRRATNTSIFYGSAATDARMWQGVNSIMAPVLEITRTPQTLKAYGGADSRGAVVLANFTSEMGAKRQVSAVRVSSERLFYSDADRRGDFLGDVTAQDPDGTIHADEAEIYLTPTPKPGKNQQAQLERIVASGHIVITQPGRKGVGERLVYTADDGRYVLSGLPGHPPYLEDATKGRATGDRLIFNSRNDSVVVSGGKSSAVTETRAPR